MPSPFPGMDPYLEHPIHFPGLHDSMIAYLRETLQAQLPEPYYAEIGERLWVEVSERRIGPDVDILKKDDDHPPVLESGGVAVVAPPRAKPIVVTVPHDEHRESFLQIFARFEDEQVVTHIEVLSLINKTPGEHGRELYLKKQQEILQSRVHLVEIDLLRRGQHSTAVPKDRMIQETGPLDYHACVHRFDNLEDFFVYPILMEQMLPLLSIPLLPENGEVEIDLQAVFDRCYDTGPYKRRIRYQETVPEPALSKDRQKWAAAILQKRLGNGG